MRDHVDEHHEKCYPRPSRLRQVHEKMVEETIQTPTIHPATDEHPTGGLRPLWVSPQSTSGAVPFASAMADTGCQSCLAGLKIVKKLGLSIRDLIPVDIKMHAADNRDIRILGATILRLSGKHKGEERSTRQIVYVTDHTDKLFLSREACTDLGIISTTFPTMDEAEGQNPAISIGTTATPPPQ